MAILQALIAVLVRSAGKLVNMAFGWATIMLFGKVRQDRQIYLSVMAFGSVIWLVALVAAAFPVSRAWIRIAMAATALLVPALVGWLSTPLVDPARRPRGARATLVAVGRGYPYTIGLALTLIVMTVFAPILKMRNGLRGWTAQHVPVIIEPGDYLQVLDELQSALRRGRLPTRRKRAGFMLRLPTKILTVFARHAVGSLVADPLARLVGRRVEVLVHPSDLVISGRELDAARTRAVLSEHLTRTRAYLTWDKEANAVEDRLREVWDALEAGRLEGVADRLDAIERDLRTLAVPYEEWEVLFRQTLMAERALLRKPASAFVKTPAFGRRLVATLVAAAPIVMQAADTVREVRELVTPPERRNGSTLGRVTRFLRRAA